MSDPKRILVVFKTHLDVGFTDFAKNVTRSYMTSYLPQSMKVAKALRGEKEGFIWTVGSWLIEKYLEEGSDKAALEDAIRHGEVRWHGMPFTTHSELMDEALFQYGLSISQKLDARFGMKTIAAKMTDVPGHTKAIIPHLYRAGIRFLHIGVNPASTRPSVPDLFRWRADSGEEIVVMYNSDYGIPTPIGNSGITVYFAHTGDNLGPQSPEAIKGIYHQLHEQYPEAELQAATLEDVAEVALKEEHLPVMKTEIGDSWIHGIGSDPGKVSAFRSLLSMKNTLSREDMEKIYQHLLLVPEHTWGLDEKVHLGTASIDGMGEHRYFLRREFESARSGEKFQKMEQSWAEQRDYIKTAVESLSADARLMAEKAVSQYCRQPTDVAGWEVILPNTPVTIGCYEVQINRQGAVCSLSKNGLLLADEAHPLGLFLYQVLSQNEYDRWRKQYVISNEQWAIEDFGKLGVDKAVDRQKDYTARILGIFRRENTIVATMKLDEEAVSLYGGMDRLEMRMEFDETEVRFDFAWFGKHASRVPEASWLQFSPVDTIVSIQKMGVAIAPAQVVDNGNKHMHAAENVRFTHMTLENADAPLVALGKPWLMEFDNSTPDLEHGVSCNLHNNVWGTNFVMWYEDDARFRYTLYLADS